MKTVLSLFDETGTTVRPYWEAGWNVVQVDLAHGTDVRDFNCEMLMDMLDGQIVDHLLMQPPCTDFASSGARWWNAKDEDGRTAASVELVAQALRAAEFLKPDVWWLENPAGRLEKLCPWIGKRQMIFDPCDFAGWVEGTGPEHLELLQGIRAKAERQAWAEITDEETRLTAELNAYTKRTCLWGVFQHPERRRLEPVKVCAAGSWLMRLGGKSDRTKTARSETAEGFARAMFEANADVALDWEAIDEGLVQYPFDFEAGQHLEAGEQPQLFLQA